nr:MAG TPA: hypothetical protein [Caudoviricetes sp.]
MTEVAGFLLLRLCNLCLHRLDFRSSYGIFSCFAR